MEHQLRRPGYAKRYPMKSTSRLRAWVTSAAVGKPRIRYFPRRTGRFGEAPGCSASLPTRCGSPLADRRSRLASRPGPRFFPRSALAILSPDPPAGGEERRRRYRMATTEARSPRGRLRKDFAVLLGRFPRRLQSRRAPITPSPLWGAEQAPASQRGGGTAGTNVARRSRPPRPLELSTLPKGGGLRALRFSWIHGQSA
jgi:hypothetical protein